MRLGLRIITSFLVVHSWTSSITFWDMMILHLMNPYLQKTYIVIFTFFARLIPFTKLYFGMFHPFMNDTKKLFFFKFYRTETLVQFRLKSINFGLQCNQQFSKLSVQDENVEKKLASCVVHAFREEDITRKCFIPFYLQWFMILYS